MRLLPGQLRVGVDIGSTTIKIAGIRHKRKAYQLEFYDVVDLTQEYAVQSYDDITDNMYIEQLRNLGMKHHLKDAAVHATLPSNLAILHSLMLDPTQPDLNMEEFIQEKLREVTLDDLGEMQIVCQQLDNVEHQDPELVLMACAVPNLVLNRYLNILHQSGLKPAVIDLDALGVYNAFYFFCNKEITFPLTVVQIGSQYTICSILLPGKKPFFKVIPLGGNSITKRIMEEFNFSLSQAEAFKSRFFQPRWANRPSYKKSQLSNILNDFSEQLVSEIKRCLRHFQAFEGVGQDGNIYLTGGGAKLEILAKLFSEQLKIETTIWNPLNFFTKTNDAQDDLARQQKGIYLTPAIGTLLRGD